MTVPPALAQDCKPARGPDAVSWNETEAIAFMRCLELNKPPAEPRGALCRMADAVAFAVSPLQFAGVDNAHAPFDAVFSALNPSFSRLSSARRHTSPVAAAQAAAMRTRARFMFIAIATN